MSRWHTHKTANRKQTRETDGQADGERWKTDKSHRAGVHLLVGMDSMGRGTEGHAGTAPALSSRGCRDVGLGTSCRSCSSAPAPRGSVGERLPEPWALHQVCVAQKAVSARVVLSSFASSCSEEQTLSPIQPQSPLSSRVL